MSEHPTIDEVLKMNPLLRFSVYTQAQVDAIKRLSAEIVELLDQSMSPGTVDGPGFQRIYGLFWLWVLGVYEIVRTMSEQKNCFSEKLKTEIASFKATISLLRMPFAKQQFRGRKVPISNENSVYGFDTTKRDMSFNVEGTVVSVREIMQAFDEFIQSITASDVLSDLREHRTR